MKPDEAFDEAEKRISEAQRFGSTKLDLHGMGLTEVPESVCRLTHLRVLSLTDNQLTALPESLGQLTLLTELRVSNNELRVLPDALGYLRALENLFIDHNPLTTLPASYKNLALQHFGVGSINEGLQLDLFSVKSISTLWIQELDLESVPSWLGQFETIEHLWVDGNSLSDLPQTLGQLKNLVTLVLGQTQIGNPLKVLPSCIRHLKKLEVLWLAGCQLECLPEWIGELSDIKHLKLSTNKLSDLPPSLAQLGHLTKLDLDDNPLSPALQSASLAGVDAVKAYLQSLQANTEPLYEAKLVLVGEGSVGKTTLLKALKGKEDEAPKEGQSTTHGVEIDIRGLRLLHPREKGVEIQLNAWDFGGQDVYRVTHQFFFSRRSLYLLVWEPRRNVQQCQVEDWLNMIQLRVGDDARVLIISTHCKSGGHLARIDQPVLIQQYGNMVVGFHEVDSLVPDESTGEMVGIAELKEILAQESAKLDHMGMPFNRNWKAARDELLSSAEPRISYGTFIDICAEHGLSQLDADTLAHLMHDLGYIVHYRDDERLRDDVVLQPQWLSKAIGFVLEDPVTRENDGILPDYRLHQVWHDHPFEGEPRYPSSLYPFFLRLMEKYDVSYRLPEDRNASLVAQHVPQVRPALPWLPEQNPPINFRRIAMICAMEEEPPGLVPWMIVRTHDYTVERNGHRLHWEKGMFLCHHPHGESMVEKRGRELHIYVQAVWPEYFMNVLQHTLQKLIADNWPGMSGRYRFAVPCPELIEEKTCKGRFSIQALRQWLAEGDTTARCADCYKRQSISELLFGFTERSADAQLREINQKLDGIDSRIANYFMATMHAIANEAKDGPRLFTFRTRDVSVLKRPLFTHPMELQLWCEAEGCQHPVAEQDKGVYPVDQLDDWVMKIARTAPYAKVALEVLKTVASIAVPSINTFFGANAAETLGIKDQLDLTKAIIDKLPTVIKAPDHDVRPGKMLDGAERLGILALHSLLRELDPHHERLGLHRVPTYTGDYRWLCKQHYDAWQPNIPELIE